MKVDDTQTVPLCRICHNQEHTGFGLDKKILMRAMVKYLTEYIRGIKSCEFF